MDLVKEAFQRIKEEMQSLRIEISSLRTELNYLKLSPTYSQNPTQNNPLTSNPTDKLADLPTVPQEMKGLKEPLLSFSTRNEGVPTDISTHTQTNRQTDFLDSFMRENSQKLNLEDVQETINTLDNLKKELRLKFKRLTPQEMLVFSAIYSLETKGVEEITYKTLANNLNLSESSIRDYVIKLTSKGIPIVKRRVNNKQIALQISLNLQKVASLSTIIKLREL
jgi:predicted transcriptional regulator